ncbi:hypothetical protein [Clostridium massiliodielmoense]|uniref:hypothetical protein n=1 Tax=Clostridium massiliodielmoense TaxID=1776385 RepID=UPI00016687A6|nr:hypothetical protein [Clostridium massiliodielmoense]EDS77780.1 conserved hypothetical protein [Clostridium botulinum C str. Eklund]KEH96003.1 hypothetical protein Z962_07585 [Clostridium botulinum C/D str. BKT12695]NEZ49639.1 hypothetical protein [Clostridium botulinum]
MTINNENHIPAIPTGFLDNVSNMLSFEDDVLSDDNGRLSIDDLEALREEMKKQLTLISSNILTDLNLIYDFDLQNEDINKTILNIFNDFGVNLIKKLSTRYQNAHIRITYGTVVEYVFGEISKSKIEEISSKILDCIENDYAMLDNTCAKENYKNKTIYIVEMELRSLEDKFKLINVPSESAQTKSNNINLDLNINDPKFVENTIKKVDALLDNDGKKAMLKYIEKLANEIIKLK